MDAPGSGRAQPTSSRRLVPIRLGGAAAPPLPVRQAAAVPIRVVAPELPDTRRTAPGRLGLGQQVLISLMVVGVVIGMVGSGTFASFNAVTKNTVAITSGDLVLSDKVNAGSECFSAGGVAPSNPQTVTAANSGGCTGVWGITTQTPGTAIAPLQMTIRNAGNLTASALDIYAQAACADSNNGAGYHGGGSLCGQVQLEIEQYTDSTFGTPSHCWYGSTSGSLCLAEANKTPGGCNVSTCTTYPFSDATHTLSNFGSTITSAAPINTGALAASGGKAYFLVFANLPGTSGDTFQGRRADLTFTWHIIQ
ncbi:MAG TPA: SipW-dependent-type signal peptide-containing protein [Candidatus Dormibacteraeota bacterium]|nr:SipW-dependent-type signal peptide-containing protein [Candidatus Dormibacteraeota bacterium]